VRPVALAHGPGRPDDAPAARITRKSSSCLPLELPPTCFTHGHLAKRLSPLGLHPLQRQALPRTLAPSAIPTPTRRLPSQPNQVRDRLSRRTSHARSPSRNPRVHRPTISAESSPRRTQQTHFARRLSFTQHARPALFTLRMRIERAPAAPAISAESSPRRTQQTHFVRPLSFTQPARPPLCHLSRIKSATQSTDALLHARSPSPNPRVHRPVHAPHAA
jgi:hypothetical protein